MEQAREAGLHVDGIEEYRVVHLAGDIDRNEVGQILEIFEKSGKEVGII